MSINKNSQKTPNLRFKGFTDDWEQRKLKEVSVYSNGGSYENDVKESGKYELITLKSVDMTGNLVSSGKFIDKEEVPTLKEGTLIMVLSEQSPGLLGMTAEIPESNKYVLNQRVAGIVPTGKNDGYFLSMAININQRYFSKRGAGTKVQNISKGNVENFEFFCPTSNEQRIIGTFFKNFNETIALHQRKLDQLNQLKEALLQQMFPGKGETVPKLRFAGFEGDWEERKLSALFIKGGSGGTPKSTNKDFYEGNIPFLGISDITKSNGFINNTEKHISVDGLNNSAAWVVPRGSISLAMYASVGKVAVLNIDVATSQAFYNMVFDDDDLRDFVYQCLIKANELSEWNKLISTGTQANLNADKVKNFMLYLPQNHAEIKLISAFLKQFDTTIAIQQRKLDQLKNMKQVLLENMFI